MTKIFIIFVTKFCFFAIVLNHQKTFVILKTWINFWSSQNCKLIWPQNGYLSYFTNEIRFSWFFLEEWVDVLRGHQGVQLISRLGYLLLLRMFSSAGNSQDVFPWLLYSWNAWYFLCWILFTSFVPKICVSLHVVTGLSFTQFECLLTLFNKQETGAGIPSIFRWKNRLKSSFFFSTPGKRKQEI